jgi:hypothetical protein
MFLALLLSESFAGGFYTEEELTDLVELAVIGEITESTCLSSSQNDNDNTETYIYEATIIVSEEKINLNSVDTSVGLTLRSINTVYLGDQPGCDQNDSAHPVGESGTYYLSVPSADDGEYTLYSGGSGFFAAADSDPGEAPACPELDQPIENDDDDLLVEEKGCASVVGSAWLFLVGLIGLRRRQ